MTLGKPAGAETSPALARRIHLAEGFEARAVMVQGKWLTEGGEYPGNPDLITVFPQADGGTTLYINHEIESGGPVGEASITMIQLNAEGQVSQSATVAKGQRNLCSGMVSPWGTVLACEEFPRSGMLQEGFVWEFDPKSKTMSRREALGRFSHESVAFDASGRCYLTEDFQPGHLFRFTPDPPGQLQKGLLEVLDVQGRRWIRIRDPEKANREARDLGGRTALSAPEGIDPWPGGGFAVALTGLPQAPDKFGRIVRLDPDRAALTEVARGDPKTFLHPDNLRFRPGGWLYFCEDRIPESLSAYGPNRVLALNPGKKILKVLATIPEGEPSGLAFHPDGKRCYLNTMQETESLTLEIRGSFDEWEKSY